MKEQDKKIMMWMFTIVVVFAGIIWFTLSMIADAKDDCDAYYKEKIDAFIEENNVCLGNINERLEDFNLSEHFDIEGWEVGE